MAYTTIDDPSAHFQTVIYTGNGTGQAITFDGNSNMQPDFFWGKCRSTSSGNHLQNSTTGVKPFLVSNSNAAENTDSNNTDFLSYDSNGFTLGASYQTDINHNARTYVAWNWKANGGTTTTNDASSTSVGSIDSVYQANTKAGFSIVTYTGTGSTATVAHGLGAVPDMLIFKKRSAQDNWYVYHKSITNDYYLVLDTTGARNNDVNIWNDTDPTSTVFSIANAGVHADGKTMVCYAFAEKKGYSKFGSYTGNGSADGAFVYLGFSPAWLMVKNTESANVWQVYDNKRGMPNPNTHRINIHTSDAESGTSDSERMDFLSNGFKMRDTSGNVNSAHKYIYMAFAESPLVSSKGTPTTAR